jgi:hypothetical protein
MRFSLHIFFALAALAFVSAAATFGAERGLAMANPGERNMLQQTANPVR